MEGTTTETNTEAAKPAPVNKELVKLEKENAALKDKLAKATEANKKIADEKKAVSNELNAAKIEITSLKQENETLKSQPTAEQPVKKVNNIITLGDGKVVQINFGVNVPELGSSLTIEELLTNEEAVTYLLEIGSGAVSIVNADTKTEEV